MPQELGERTITSYVGGEHSRFGIHPPSHTGTGGVGVCSVQCAVCSVLYAVCSVLYAVCSVQCAVCSVQCRVPAMFEGEVLLATCTVVVRTVVYRIQNSKGTEYIPVVYSIQNSKVQCILDYFKVRDLSSFVQLCTMH